ncbi:MAG: porin [Rhodoferax sp.]|nr:porin [Rhodoferax sp.]
MKKSLVALAALTLVGAASAQVTITGTLSFSNQQSLDRTRGIAVTDNSFNFGITEDLGGGLKLTAKTGFDAGGRNTAFTGAAGMEDFRLGVSGGFGALNMASYESDGPFANVAISGASLPVGPFDANGANMGKRARNAITYVSPNFSGFTGALTYVTPAGTYAPEDTLDANNKVVPALTYAAGPLKAYVEVAMFNQSYNNNADDRVTHPTAYVSYDFGVAKVAAGWTKPSNRGATVGLGLNVPLGALTLGAETFSYNNVQPGNIGAGTYSDIAISYALSKRTSIKTSFGTVNDAFIAYSTANAFGQTNLATSATGSTNNQTRVGIFHSF